jgi:two-component system, sensor histidine kinase
MSQSDFFFERVASEISLQMEGVLALVDRLARQTLTPDGLSCVAGVGEAAASVKQIIAASADLQEASSEAGLVLEPTPVKLQTLIDQLEARWKDRATAAGVTLLVSYDGDPDAAVMIDATRALQVFDGLISQAVAGASRGAIETTLRARADGNTVRLEGRVRGGAERDLGNRPLDIREVEALFGLETALGIELGRQVLNLMGGEERTESNPGGGETLIFTLEAPIVMDAVVEEPTTDSTAHILVVDDNATNRMVAETLCAMFACTTESVADGLEAVEAARSGRFDLILMDIKMPQMDGVAATREIRTFGGRAGQVPIIALTANADPDDAAGYIAAGMNGVVEKPMKPENLLRALQENLDGGETTARAA